ncbi:MAG: DoxX family membrane protein [Verrucomicrobia bacterium]|nr:DoxX family membrane protein [Verrucomicrobiota bacterium]
MAKLLVLVLRVLVSLVFIYTGVMKVFTPVRFATDISNYHLLPWTGAAVLAFYLPWLEIVSALALWWSRLCAGASFLLLAMVLVFIAASVTARLRGIDVSCGCFGNAGRNLTFTSHLLIDLALFLVLLILSGFEIRQSRLRQAGSVTPILSC